MAWPFEYTHHPPQPVDSPPTLFEILTPAMIQVFCLIFRQHKIVRPVGVALLELNNQALGILILVEIVPDVHCGGDTTMLERGYRREGFSTGAGSPAHTSPAIEPPSYSRLLLWAIPSRGSPLNTTGWNSSCEGTARKRSAMLFYHTETRDFSTGYRKKEFRNPAGRTYVDKPDPSTY